MYADLTDEELDAKIIELRGKLETVAGGGVSVIAGEGRRKEFARGNSTDLKRLYQDAVNEREKRQNGGTLRGRALGVGYI